MRCGTQNVAYIIIFYKNLIITTDNLTEIFWEYLIVASTLIKCLK